MSADDHERHARNRAATAPIRLAIVTVSDTRTSETDQGGDAAAMTATAGGVQVVERRWTTDDPSAIERTLDELQDLESLDAIVLTGGTGLGPRDGTVEVVRRRLRLELPGFGEQVRALGWRDVGPASMLSRAVGGVLESSNGRRLLVFAMPGSVGAVQSVMRELVVPVLPHAVWDLRGRPASPSS
jgi:molybdenum cofactor biosynthesis protein B